MVLVNWLVLQIWHAEGAQKRLLRRTEQQREDFIVGYGIRLLEIINLSI